MANHHPNRTLLPLSAVLILAAALIPAMATPAMAQATIGITEAVLQTLADNPGVHIEKQKLVQSQATLQTASGQFDWVGFSSVSRERQRLPLSDADIKTQRDRISEQQNQVDQLNQIIGVLNKPPVSAGLATASPATASPLVDESETYRTTYSAGVTRQSRSGITVTPSVSARDTKNNTDTTVPANRSDANVQIVVPLLRGLGASATAAQEMAARNNLEVSRQLWRHNISRRIFQTAAAFWNCLAAQNNLAVMEDTNQRARQVYDLVELLIKGGELEPALRHQADGRLAGRQANLSDVRLALFRSRQALGINMGLSTGQLANAPAPEGDFPAAIDPSGINDAAVGQWIQQALQQRGDYLAAKGNIATETLLVGKARNDLKPRLDLDLRAGYAGIDQGHDGGRYGGSLSQDQRGPNAYAGLSLQWPFANNTARGELLRRQALVREAELTTAQLANAVASEVLVAAEAVRVALTEYQAAANAAMAYQKAVAHENRKLKGGDASLSDLIDMEDRYAQARLAEIEAVRKYAVALAELRLVTGTLVTADQDNINFVPASLAHLPRVENP